MENAAANLHRPIAVRTNPQKRIVMIGVVGIIHIAAIYAVVTGLVPSITHIVDGPTVMVPPVDPAPPKKNPEIVRQKDLEKSFVDPKTVTAVPPDVRIARDTGPITPVYGDPRPAHPPTAAQTVAGTHTIPAYPQMAIRLSQQGTVTLRLNVAADGSVGDARVETSSGSSYLDEAAIAWVKLHWRYKPATENGVAVASSTLAAVQFDLRNAR